MLSTSRRQLQGSSSINVGGERIKPSNLSAGVLSAVLSGAHTLTHKQGFVAHVYWRIDTFYILIQKSRCSATLFKSWGSEQLLNQCV